MSLNSTPDVSDLTDVIVDSSSLVAVAVAGDHSSVQPPTQCVQCTFCTSQSSTVNPVINVAPVTNAAVDLYRFRVGSSEPLTSTLGFQYSTVQKTQEQHSANPQTVQTQPIYSFHPILPTFPEIPSAAAAAGFSPFAPYSSYPNNPFDVRNGIFHPLNQN